MTPLSVLEAVAIPVAFLALIGYAYWWDSRQQRRAAELARLWRQQQAARYRAWEFDVSPPPYDQAQDEVA